MKFNYLVKLSFIGTDFHGWQIQPGVPTVQGRLKSAIETVLRTEVKLIGCCRTDAGVHAKEYIANFLTDKEADEEKLLKALNGILPEDIGVLEIRRVDKNFNARYSVKGKLYVYRIWNSASRNPFISPFSVRILKKLNTELMKEASELLCGEHDFRGFGKIEEEEEKNTVINLDVKVEVKGELIELQFKASHFLRYMVRRLSGFLIKLGEGKEDIENLKDYLSGKEFTYTAPARGLTLEKVFL